MFHEYGRVPVAIFVNPGLGIANLRQEQAVMVFTNSTAGPGLPVFKFDWHSLPTAQRGVPAQPLLDWMNCVMRSDV